MNSFKDEMPLRAKLEALRDPRAYPERSDRVVAKETHMSWVFLTRDSAYKLKKPIRSHLFDWTTLKARREDCEREVELNRRLASGVYHGVVPLTIDESERLQLEGDGAVIEHLVKMRRLPEERMLDVQIERRTVRDDDVRRAVAILAEFYGCAKPFDISGPAYLDHLRTDLHQSRRELLEPQFAQNGALATRVHTALLAFTERETDLLQQRVAAGRVIDAHGDLRPEHICLERPRPAVIDCLQFSQRLRILDTASELSFLNLECERLGAPRLADIIWPTYRNLCNDDPPEKLICFYQALHACLRAMVSVWHLTDDDVSQPGKWTRKADRYLQTADRLTQQFA